MLKVKEIVTPKGEIDDESKEQRNLESNLQSIKQQVGEEEAATANSRYTISNSGP
jgi:hypothetical protein